MATQAERAFVQHLTITSSIEKIVEIGLPLEVFADEDLRAVYAAALTYYHDDHLGGQAPSPEMMEMHFCNALAEHEIDLSIDPEDSLIWSMNALRGAYVDRQWQHWVKDFAMTMSTADVMEKPSVLSDALNKLMTIQTAITRKSEKVDVRDGISERFAAYISRERESNISRQIRGIPIGLPAVDEHTNGIWPGELAILAAGPKTGKSFALLHSAMTHWAAGGTPVLFTLENSVEMTQDRLACMALHIDPRAWNRGQLTEEQKKMVADWVEENVKSRDRSFWVLQPEPGKRTVEAMVRQARTLGDAVYIDQLTFVDVPSQSDRLPRHIQVRDILHELKSIISSGDRIPCLLAHQINREGVKAAEKSNRLEMYHLAESSEVERTADWVFGLWQSEGLRAASSAYLQTLAARREDLLNWQLIWVPHLGRVAAVGQIDFRSQ